MALGWASAIGTWFAYGYEAVLHGLGTKRHADLHLFNDNEYMWHNLQTDIAMSATFRYYQQIQPYK